MGADFKGTSALRAAVKPDFSHTAQPSSSLRFHDEIHNRCLTNIEHFVPFDSVARETAAGDELDLARPFRVGDPHAAARDRVAEVTPVMVALVTDGRWEGAAKHTLV
jgi:hypothetical protein